MRGVAAGLALVVVGGCAAYHAKPLRGPALASLQEPTQQALAQAARRLKVPGIPPLVLNFRKPLSGRELGVIAVLVNPGLRALRARQGVAQAQVFAAGLLPDPVVQGSVLRPYGLGAGGREAALSDGFLWDLSRLVTRGADIQGAKEHALSIDYGVAWHEWVVANEARLAARRLYWLRQEWEVARRAARIFERPERLLAQDARSHLVAGARVLAWQTALDTLRLQAAGLHRAFVRAGLSLNADLGLPPHAHWRLGPPRPLHPSLVSAHRLFRQALGRRLDLVALVAAYHSANEALLRAILDQYPRLSLGLAGARNSSGVSEAGLQLSLVLPLFNANRGAVAIARARRAALFKSYVARLAGARAQIYQLRAMVVSFDRELGRLKGRADALRAATQAAQASYKAHALSLFPYLTLMQELVAVRLHLLALHLSRATTLIALQVATARPWSARPS